MFNRRSGYSVEICALPCSIDHPETEDAGCEYQHQEDWQDNRIEANGYTGDYDRNYGVHDSEPALSTPGAVEILETSPPLRHGASRGTKSVSKGEYSKSLALGVLEIGTPSARALDLPPVG